MLGTFPPCNFSLDYPEEILEWKLYMLHWHVFTWIWETCHAWYQQVVITGREMKASRSLSHWIIESADYVLLIKLLILSTELFSVLTQSGWYFSLCIAWRSQQWWLYISVQCILDCLPVSVCTEPVHSDDQFTNSYSNPYKLFISDMLSLSVSGISKIVHCGILINTEGGG